MANDDTLTVAVPKSLKRDLRIEAAKRDISPSELVRNAVKREIEHPATEMHDQQPTAATAGAV